MSDFKGVTEVVNKIAEAVEEQRKVNDQRIEEVIKGNDARAKELDEKWQKYDDEIVHLQKEKRALEKRMEMQQERLEILESVNDRPKGTVQDKIRSEHKDAFMSWMRAGGNNREAEEKIKALGEKAREFKDVVIGTPSSGGYAVPEEISRQVDALLLKQSDVLNFVNMVQVGTSDYKELISIHGGNSGWVGETDTRSATGTPDLRERAPTWGELYAYPQVSEWALQDIFFNVENWLVNDITDGMRKNLDSAIWSGNGSSKPTGMINQAPVSTADHASPLRNASAYQYVPMSDGSPVGFGPDSVIDLVYALNRAYRPNAAFAANTVTQGAMRKFKNDNGDYLWQPSLQAGQPDRLIGYPVFTFEDMADYSTANGLAVGFGDWRRAYTLAFRRELAVTAEGITKPGYVRFYVRRRYGGIVTNNDALKLLKIAAS
jgi:HK97 family phage major capsid protein